MSRVRQKQQLVYFPRNIRKNIKQINENQQPAQRPKTTPHRKYFASNGYIFNPNARVSQDEKALSTLQVNKLIYVRQNSIPIRKNTRSFLQTCRVQKCKESKIKYNTIEGRIDIKNDDNNMESFVDALIDSNIFFQKLQRTMVQSLSLIGTQKKYQKGEKFQLSKKNLGFVLYGKLKIYDKDFSFFAGRGDTIGEHEFFGCSRAFKIKIIDDCAILWVNITNFNILRQQTVKQGFRHDFNKIQTQLRLSFIKKKMPKD